MNPLGVQSDGVRSEGAGQVSSLIPGSTDLNPDFTWESKGRITDRGYEVEIRIPFKSLRYPGGERQSWGFNVTRVVQRTGYTDTWTDVRRANASFLGQEGAIGGLHDLERGVDGRGPAVRHRHGQRQPGRPAGGEFDREDVDPDAGLNLRLGFTSYALDATLNPDFSQVESDEGQVTVNERFALFFPEKRPFFLEGIELFGTPQTLVYTRRIVDPKAGAKLTGKFGQLGVAHLTAVDETGDRRRLVQHHPAPARLRPQLDRRGHLHQPRPGRALTTGCSRATSATSGVSTTPSSSRRLVDAATAAGDRTRADLAGGVRPHRALLGLQLSAEGARRRVRRRRRDS